LSSSSSWWGDDDKKIAAIMVAMTMNLEQKEGLVFWRKKIMQLIQMVTITITCCVHVEAIQATETTIFDCLRSISAVTTAHFADCTNKDCVYSITLAIKHQVSADMGTNAKMQQRESVSSNTKRKG